MLQKSGTYHPIKNCHIIEHKNCGMKGLEVRVNWITLKDKENFLWILIRKYLDLIFQIDFKHIYYHNKFMKD